MDQLAWSFGLNPVDSWKLKALGGALARPPTLCIAPQRPERRRVEERGRKDTMKHKDATSWLHGLVRGGFQNT